MDDKTMQRRRPYELAVLICWTIFFLYILLSGKLSYYINPKFAFLPVVGVIICIAMAFAVWKYGLKFACHDLPNDRSFLPWFMMPVVMALLIAPTIPGVAGGDGEVGKIIGKEEIYQYGSASKDFKKTNLKLLLESPIKDGDRVSFVAQISTDGNAVKPGYAFLMHYTMTCCAAHIQPMYVMSKMPEGYKPADKQWVDVAGTVRTDKEMGMVIEVDAMKYVKRPSPPYLF
ncbi:MAG: hypothetical protein SNJ70_03990 [Armatimonadota bacterium]